MLNCYEMNLIFTLIGISEIKLTNCYKNNAHPSIPGYVFEVVSTPLAFKGARLFVDKLLKYNVLEKKLNLRHSKPSGLKSLLSTTKTSFVE